MVMQIFKKWFGKETTDEVKNTVTVITSRDIKAIAGEDVMATQLDLARAYIELGKINLAKQILQHVIKNGTESEKQAAEQLLVYL
ncbi:MAG TPA: FimV/HubP family polar landmark protein [Gammaproteobacteria bacterium]|jgi:pilus assembly protein FimV|nr:FimV/HubP family polar landmark protein [Gammaproteobacteria bacterium]